MTPLLLGTMCASIKVRYRGNNGGQGLSRTRTNFCGWGQEGPLVEYPEEQGVGARGWPTLEGQHIGGGWGLDGCREGCRGL